MKRVIFKVLRFIDEWYIIDILMYLILGGLTVLIIKYIAQLLM